MLKKLFKQIWNMWEKPPRINSKGAIMKLTEFLNALDENIQIGLTFVDENGIYYCINEEDKGLLDICRCMSIQTSQLPIKEQIEYLKKGNFTISKISSIHSSMFWKTDFIKVVLQSN